MFMSLIAVETGSDSVMTEPAILILGGTSLAGQLARALADTGIRAIYSLAGRTNPWNLPDTEVRIGGFGGIEAMVEFMRQENITAVVDATHAYAAQISDNACRACGQTDVPLLRLEEPAWKPQPGDNWIEAVDVEEARNIATGITGRMLVTTGRQSIPTFAKDKRCWWLIRIVPTEDNLPELANGIYLQDRGPFEVSDELKLMREHRIDVVISKNAGSAATCAKIEAARELAIPVIMINRPPASPADTVSSVKEVINWLEQIPD